MQLELNVKAKGGRPIAAPWQRVPATRRHEVRLQELRRLRLPLEESDMRLRDRRFLSLP